MKMIKPENSENMKEMTQHKQWTSLIEFERIFETFIIKCASLKIPILICLIYFRGDNHVFYKIKTHCHWLPFYKFKANKLWVQGGGHVHAVHVDMEAKDLIVDDLGLIVGDIHDAPCTTGNGFSSTSGGSGNVK